MYIMDYDFRPEKGQNFEIEIEDMSGEGAGIGRVNGLTVFVNGAVYKDVVSCEITKLKKNYCFAKLIDIIKESPFRREGYCIYSDRCGGCHYHALNYEGQLELKEKQVRDKLGRIGGFTCIPMEEIVAMENPLRYRNKATCMISTGGIITKKGGIIENVGEPVVGFFKQKSHNVCDCSDCAIQADTVSVVADVLRKFMANDNITAYDNRWEKGLMKKVIVRTAFNTGEVMVIFQVNGKGIPNHLKLISMLDDAIFNMPPTDTGVQYSLESVILAYEIKNDKRGELKFVTLAGKGTIREELGNMQYEISPGAFFQVNSIQTVKLYDKVLEFINPSGAEDVWDVYCGVGTIGLYIAKNVRSVIGIESIKDAIIDANRNAVINGIVNAVYRCGDAEAEIKKLLYEGKSCDVAILDPPRSGCSPNLLKALADSNVVKIVYVSCDPATLARDLKQLSEMGYSLKKIACFDQFANSKHVESIAVLIKSEMDEN